ncbi:response regulator [Gemmata sp. G18]|uniref:Response regulator n=1 Tax=Gemmata palustris TaxID=2822762 RepID=A0ABS5BSP9_9BACT|nr:response regulator [Gemmata palustris]MBP3956723.1 response regulator [Gemmata palustris]
MPRILVVDDDPVLRKAVRRMLEPEGFEIEEAEDGRDGLRRFRARPADLALCDLFMPERDGLEFLRELSREFVGGKVVTMSGGNGHGTVDLLPLAKFLGADGTLYKPFKQADLLKAIRHVLSSIPN